MRSWYENEELLRRFREWLGRTEAEIAELGLAGQFEDAPAENLPDVGSSSWSKPSPPCARRSSCRPRAIAAWKMSCTKRLPD
jgi:hypothetical protein